MSRRLSCQERTGRDAELPLGKYRCLNHIGANEKQFLCGLWLIYDVVLLYLRNKNHNWVRNTKIKRNGEKCSEISEVTFHISGISEHGLCGLWSCSAPSSLRPMPPFASFFVRNQMQLLKKKKLFGTYIF